MTVRVAHTKSVNHAHTRSNHTHFLKNEAFVTDSLRSLAIDRA